MRPLLTLSLLIASHAWAQPIVVDGRFDDWSPAAASVTDPAGDATGQLDATGLSGALVGDTVFVRLDIAVVQNLQAGSEPEPDLTLVVEPDGLPAIELACRGRFVRRLDNGQVLTWGAVRYAVAPTFAAPSFEMRLDLSSLGSVGPGGVSLTVGGCDGLDAPLMVTDVTRDRVPTPARVDAVWRRSLRLASLNTLRTGLSAPGQASKLARLVVAADADVYLLQEEYNSSEAQLVALFDSIRPLAGGAHWQVHKRGDTAVVSRWPLVNLPNYDTSYSAAGAMTDNGPVVIVSIHPKCCGYIGSSEDARRIDQAHLTARLIDEVRAGQHDGPATLSGAPVIIGGDWNLVGSRTPLDVLTAPQLANMAELNLVRAGAGDTTTWRELDGLGFAPGRLDLIVYDSESLKPVRAEVMDTALMSPERRARLGLEPDDSTGSDHYMLVAEFGLTPGP